MRRPQCEICGATSLLAARKFADYQPSSDGTKGDPRGLGYFCCLHDQADTHLGLGEAIQKIHEGTEGEPVDPEPAPPPL